MLLARMIKQSEITTARIRDLENAKRNNVGISSTLFSFRIETLISDGSTGYFKWVWWSNTSTNFYVKAKITFGKLTEEILKSRSATNQCYSVVIHSFHDLIQPDFIQPKMYKYDKHGQIMRSSNGAPYGEYISSDDIDMREYPVMQFMTPQSIYNDLTKQLPEVSIFTFWWFFFSTIEACHQIEFSSSVQIWNDKAEDIFQ